MRVGLNLPQYEIDLGGAPLRIVDAARAAEGAGFDSVWVSDHPFAVAPGGSVSGALDALVSMGHIAAATSRIAVGSLVLACSMRSRGELEAAARALASVAPGRIVFGLGTGWFEPEHHAYGVQRRPYKERLRALDDAASAIGDDDIEILIGGTGEGLLDVAAWRAHTWNCSWDVAKEAFASLSARLDEASARAGRTVRRSVGVTVLLADEREEAIKAVERVRARAPFLRAINLEEIERGIIVGDAQECARRIAAYGADEVVITSFVRDDLDAIRALGERVVPLLHAEGGG